MIAAEEKLRGGDLSGALADLQAEIRLRPAEPSLRIFLFQLLAIMGQWERALSQLKIIGDLDSQALIMVQAYREVIQCERLREEVFAGRLQPLVLGSPQRWIALALQSLSHMAAGELEMGAELREEAYEFAPAIGGSIDDQPFEWIADADSRIGPFLELLVDGKYYWSPFDRIAEIKLEPPEDLRDLVWMPAQFTWANGGQSVGFIPSRYPGTEGQSDDRLRLARTTEWLAIGDDLYAGLGQRMFVTDAGEHSLLDVRRFCFAGSESVSDVKGDPDA